MARARSGPTRGRAAGLCVHGHQLGVRAEAAVRPVDLARTRSTSARAAVKVAVQHEQARPRAQRPPVGRDEHVRSRRWTRGRSLSSSRRSVPAWRSVSPSPPSSRSRPPASFDAGHDRGLRAGRDRAVVGRRGKPADRARRRDAEHGGPDRHPAQAPIGPGPSLDAPVVGGVHAPILRPRSFRDRDTGAGRPAARLTPSAGRARVVAIVHPGPRPSRRRPAASTAGATDDRYRSPAHRHGPGGHARRQPVGRPPQQGRVRGSQGLPAAGRHRPRRVLGRQRPPGLGLLPCALGLHAGRVLWPRDRRPGPRELRDAAARHPDRADGAADPRRRDRRARASPRRRRPRHRVRGPGLGRVVAGDHRPRREVGDGARRARRRRGRRAAPERRLDLRRGPAQLRRPARLPRRLRARLSEGQEARRRGAGPEPARGRPLRRQRRAWAT